MSRRSTLAAALALPFLSCSNPDGLSPTGTGALALRILPTSGVPFTSGRVILTVTKDTTVDATPGQPVTISNLPAGPYMVGLEGFVGDSVSSFQQLTVTIVAGQTARPMIALQPFGTVIDSMPTYTTSGQTFTVLFEKVAVATSYVVQKDSFATFVTSHDTTVLATSAQIAIPPTGPYFVRVAAVDAYGKRGTPSAARPITTLITCCVITPTGASITAQGGTQLFSVAGRDPKGNVVNNVSATWRSLNPSVATVAAGTGLVTGVGIGQSTILATVAGTSAASLVTVAYSITPGVNVWSAISGGAYELDGIWGSSGTDLFAVGSLGHIVHFDGTSWNPMPSATTRYLHRVWGSSPLNVFAVGDSGTIVRFDGSAWTVMQSGTTQYLFGLWGSGPSDVFAVGGVILHFNGTGWTALSGAPNEAWRAVWGTAANDVWVVGLGGALVHFDGTTWRSTGSALGDFNGVRGTSSSDVLAVSQSTITGAGRIYHFDGVSWNLNATIGGDLTDVFSVSSSEAYVAESSGLVLRYDGTAWATPASSPTPAFLTGIWSTPTGDLFASGYLGVVLRGVRGAPFQAFGYPTSFAGSVNWASQILVGEPISITTKIELTTFGLISYGANDSVQLALYTDVSGAPTTLVAQTAHALIGGAGVHEFPSTLQTQLQPGTYWIMSKYAFGNTVVYQDNTTTSIWKQVSDSFGVALPNPYPASPTTLPGRGNMSYYVKGYVVP